MRRPGPGRRAGPPAAMIGIAVALAAAAGLLAVGHAPVLAVPRAAAIADVMRAPATRAIIARTHPDRLVVSAVDRRIDRVSLFTGSRIVGQAAVARGGAVSQVDDFSRRAIPYGNWIAFRPLVLAALAALFLIMAGVWPLRRARNIDAVAAASLVVPVVLLQQRYLGASVLAALPGLLWLLGRSLWWAFADHAVAAPSQSLFGMLTRSWPSARRVRVLRLLLLALGLVFLMVGVSSPQPVDVLYAVMEGATRLLHGALPYGHMPGDIVHGDTYPVLSYLLYTPVALVAPVHSSWDSVDLGLAVAVIAALGGAWLLAHPPRLRGPRRSPEQHEAGLLAAVIWLTFPPLLVTVSTGTTDVALAVLLLAAVLTWRGSAVSTGLLGAAGWFKLAPVLLLPIWLAGRRGRELGRAIAGFVLVSLPLLALLFFLGGLDGPIRMLRSMSFQFSRGSPQSVWSVLGLEALQPIAEASVLGLLAAAVVTVRQRPALLDDRGRLAALCAALLIGLQLSADYWAFLYLAWIVPLLVLSLLEPAPALAVSAEDVATARMAGAPGRAALAGAPVGRMA